MQWAATIGAWTIFAIPRVAAWVRGYEVLGDEAVISLRANELFLPGSPLLGMRSSLGDWSAGAEVFHPGPSVFWQMAPTSHLLGGGTGALAGSFLLAALFSWVIIDQSCRRFGPVAAPAAAAAAVMFTANSWQSSNALLGVLPALAVPFATWSILDDDRRAWPWLALAASYAVQADLAFLIPIALLVAMALVHELRRLRRGTAPQVHEGDRSGHALLATVLILVVLWIPPVIDALANRGGNLAALLEAATADIPVRGIGYATSSIITMLVPVVVTSPFWVRAWRADRPARRPLMAVAAVGTFGVAWSQAMVPVGDAPSLTQLPVYVGISFNLFASAAFTADVLLAGRARRPVLLRRVSWAGFAATALLAAPALTGASFQDEWYPAVRPVTAAIADLPGDQYRVQPLGGPVATRLALGLADATQRKGVRLRVQRALVPYLGPNHQMTADVDQVLYVSTQSTAPPVSGAKLVERWEDPAFDERARARVDRAVAREIRRRPVRWSSTDDFQIGSIVAAGGTQLDHIDDVTISELGQDVRSGRVDVRDLPDAVIAELVFQSMIELPPSSTRLRERLTRSRAATVATVWLAAA